MKILIVINALKYGGAEKQAVTDANALTAAGCSVTIAYKCSGELEGLLSSKVEKYVIRWQNAILASAQLFFHLIFKKYDVIHCHMLWEGLISFLPGKFTGHHLILNEHGLGLWRNSYHVLMTRFMAIFLDKIITSCEAVRQVRVNKERIPSSKVVTIYNSFSSGENQKCDHNYPRSYNSKRSFVIGYVGRFSAVKHLDIFVTLAQRLRGGIPNLKFVLVGDGEEKGALEKTIEENRLSSYFHMPGYILCTREAYESFDVFALPSIREGFPIALLEAGAHGIPAIAFDVGGNSEIVINDKTGYIVPVDCIDMMAERIDFLHKQEKKRRVLGMAAAEFVNSNFSVARRTVALLRQYSELCTLTM